MDYIHEATGFLEESKEEGKSPDNTQDSAWQAKGAGREEDRGKSNQNVGNGQKQGANDGDLA